MLRFLAHRKLLPIWPVKISNKQEQCKLYNDCKRLAVHPPFRPGDWARVRRPHTDHKLKCEYPASFQIQKKVGQFSYVI
jgi:hypothetical protein